MRTFAFQTSHESGQLSVTAVCIADDAKVEDIEVSGAEESSEAPGAAEAA